MNINEKSKYLAIKVEGLLVAMNKAQRKQALHHSTRDRHMPEKKSRPPRKLTPQEQMERARSDWKAITGSDPLTDQPSH